MPAEPEVDSTALDRMVSDAQQSVNASGIGRTMNCVGSVVLPRRRSAGDFADAGLVVHAFLERVLNSMRGGLPLEQARELALLEVPDSHRAACEVLDLNALSLSDEMEAEVWFALDWRTWRVRRVKGHSEVDRKTEIPAVADVVLHRAVVLGEGGVDGESVRVLLKDYKTGKGPRPPADTHWQMIVLAICARAVYGADCVDVELCYLDLEDGRATSQRASFDELELDARMERIGTLMTKRIPAAARLVHLGQAPPTGIGAWCRYCPAFHACPATQNLALVVGQGEQALARALPTEELTDEQAAHTYWMVKQAMAVCNDALRAIYGRAQRAPFLVGEHQMLGSVTKRGKAKLDGRKARETVLEVLGVEEIADAAVELSATKKGIRAAITPHCKDFGLKIGQTQAAILEALEAAGGVTRNPPHVVVEVYDPRKLTAGVKEDDDE